MNDHTEKKEKQQLPTLKPKIYDEEEFFIADEVDVNSFRSDSTSLEHPFFALKAGDTKTRTYQNGDVLVEVIPNVLGLPTIFDKDIWIYAISKIQKAINQGKPVNRVIYFTIYDFFKTVNKKLGGAQYKDFEKSLDRLIGAKLKTTLIIDENNKKIKSVGFIDEYSILLEKKGILEMGMVKLTLPEWLFSLIHNKQILKISPDYFRIRKAIDRRIYEIARKHCGNQNEFIITLDKMYIKSGSGSEFKKFKLNIKELAEKNDLPDYEIFLDAKKNLVTFKNRNKIKILTENKKDDDQKQQDEAQNKSDLLEQLKLSDNYYFYLSAINTLDAHKENKIKISDSECDFLNNMKEKFEINAEFNPSEKQKNFLTGVFNKYGTLKQQKIELSQDEIEKRRIKEEKLKSIELKAGMILVGSATQNEYLINEFCAVIGAEYQYYQQDFLSVGVNPIDQLKELVLAKRLKVGD